jgi:putative phage-type endonuclease
MQQRSPEWYAERLGIPTASRISDVMAETKNGPAASRQNYLAELVIERLTGMPTESFTSPAMLRGIELEDVARTEYEIRTEDFVDQIGFIRHPDIEMGASPDGLVGNNGLVEIKCPNSATHLKTLLKGDIKPEYIWQMQCQMTCTDREWCDFVSFDDRFPGDYSFCCIRVYRDDNAIIKMLNNTEKFISEIYETLSKLKF